MLDVHPTRHAAATWREFFIHLGTITVGLLIAISLEQGVEKLHHLHQRHQLEEDLVEEARQNRNTILRDLRLEKQSAWFRSAVVVAAGTPVRSGVITFTLPPAP
jgi:hypothetical protein